MKRAGWLRGDPFPVIREDPLPLNSRRWAVHPWEAPPGWAGRTGAGGGQAASPPRDACELDRHPGQVAGNPQRQGEEAPG